MRSAAASDGKPQQLRVGRQQFLRGHCQSGLGEECCLENVPKGTCATTQVKL